MKVNIVHLEKQSWVAGALYYESVKVMFDFVYGKNDLEEYIQWKADFINIHGFLDTQRKLDLNKLESDYGIELKNEDAIFKLLFCLETYYSIVLRFIGFKAVFSGTNFTFDLFNENYFKSKGIINYNCKKDFNWFLEMPNFSICLVDLFSAIDLKVCLGATDFIKEIFESIFPTQVRHSMGEFYTPDWLANFVIETVTKGDTDAAFKKYIDPSCGSGTFIFNLIQKYRFSSNKEIYKNVFGIDINPLSVLACKTNYLVLYSLDHKFELENKLEIPIYYADAISANSCNTELFNETVDEYEKIKIEKVDYIVGNPPWVNWEYLPKSYRMKNAHLWQHYNLFSQKGMDASFIKEDISVLLTYVVLDKYLKLNGKLGFVIKETLFKSVKQGEGFRKFKIQPTNTPINPYRVDDLTGIKPFKDAATRTALFFVTKGEEPKFPIDFVSWIPKNGKRTFDNELDISKLPDLIHFDWQKARPSEKGVSNSGWITESEDKLQQSSLVLGKSEYVGRTGVFTGGANGIFWMEIMADNGETVTVKNLTERAKNKMKNVVMELEKEFVFPFLTGNELDLWSYEYTKYILCPHTAESKMYPVEMQILKKYPETVKYFKEFKTELENRKGFTIFDRHIQLKNYYALQRIGDYTFSPYKVAWRFISKEFRPAVIEYANDKYLGTKNIIGNEKIISVGLNNKDEAYYLCGLLSSTAYRETIESYMVGTQITPSIIKRLNLPKFNSKNTSHVAISTFCKKGHASKDKKNYLKLIDELVEEMIRI
jgi:methylase of polypeptide subunit release factors